MHQLEVREERLHQAAEAELLLGLQLRGIPQAFEVDAAELGVLDQQSAELVQIRGDRAVGRDLERARVVLDLAVALSDLDAEVDQRDEHPDAAHELANLGERFEVHARPRPLPLRGRPTLPRSCHLLAADPLTNPVPPPSC